MKIRRFAKARLWVEELEPRVVLSASSPSLFDAPVHSILSATSSNWSGYAALPTTGSVSAVNGAWVVPAVTGTSTAYSSFWVGIDGYNSSTVEQIGTDSDIQNGKPTYYAWYEMYPSDSVDVSLKLDGKVVAISPKDKIDGSVTYAASTYTLTITDLTTGASFTTAQKLAGAKNSSAEWVAEAPSSGSGELPLANFGSVSFSDACATINGTTGPIDDSAWQTASINMVTGRNTVAASTGSLTDTTTAPITSSFTITYGAATTTPTPPTIPTPPTPPAPPTPPPGGHYGWGWGWGRGWRGLNDAAELVGSGDSAFGVNSMSPTNLASGSVSTSPTSAPVSTRAAIRVETPKPAPLWAISLNGPGASTADDGDMMIDDADLASIWLPASASNLRSGNSLAEAAAAHRSQPALVADGPQMQVIIGDHAHDVFAAPLPAPTPVPTPEQDSGDGGSFMARTFSKALWLVGTVALVASGALAEKSRQTDPREEERR